MTDRYLRQVIVVRKDLCMPSGKLAAMVAHAAMTFICNGIMPRVWLPDSIELLLTPIQLQWLTEVEPGLEDLWQLSFAKIVLAVKDLQELLDVETAALSAGLDCHRVVDGGHSHNKPRDIACIAIGPDWPEKLHPVTGGLKVYR